MFRTNEIFNGAIPPVCMMQILRAVDFSSWGKCYVGCSGTFTFERAIGQRYPELEMYGNDVSLLSGVLAGMARGEHAAFAFKGRVEHWEELCKDKPYAFRVGALILALFLGRVYGGKNEHAKRHWSYYEARFDDVVEAAARRAIDLTAGLRLNGYYPGDFRDHLRKGMEEGAGVIVSAPFIEGWYERWYRFINENIEWTEPAYRRWNPSDFPALMDEIDASGVPYVMVYKQEIEGREPVIYHRIGMKPPFHVYARDRAVASVVDRPSVEHGTPFAFTPVDIAKVSAKSKVEVVRCKSGYADYIKSLFLQENIQFTSAPLNFLVYIDDMLAGILSFSPPKHNIGPYKLGDYVYLLSDTSTTRYGRVSKLIAMLATCEDVLRVATKRITHRPVKAVVTTVRSNNPVSMKYRGIYDVLKRMEPGPEERSGSKYIINYSSEPRAKTPQAIFDEWLARYYRDDRERKVTTSYAA